MEETRTRVLIVEDQKLVRELLEELVEESGRYLVAHSTPNAELAEVFCAGGNVDLVLMDVYTENGADGIDACARIKKSFPSIKIIIITSMPEAGWIGRAKKAQADSFWYKEEEDISLIDLMDATMAGEHIFPEAPPLITIGLAQSNELTAREIDVLREITTGASNREIAKTLGLSAETIKMNVQSLLQKTGFSTRTILAVQARQSGIVIKRVEHNGKKQTDVPDKDSGTDMT